MTLQLELTAEQESWLQQCAARTGTDQQAALLRMLEQQRAAENPLAGLSDDAEQLRREIARELPAEVGDRHHSLTRKSQAEGLFIAENRELLELIDIVETDRAARLARVLKLARLRGEDFDALARQFGLCREVR